MVLNIMSTGSPGVLSSRLILGTLSSLNTLAIVFLSCVAMTVFKYIQ
nr:MAG TPA: hypothetical protein [Caudoviricetes sp.]